VGEWFKLPYTNEELNAVLKRIGIGECREDGSGGVYEEYFITDYENDLGLKVDEYESLSELNEVAKCVDSLNARDLQVLQAVIEMDSPNISDMVEVIENLEKYTLHVDIKTFNDLGHYLIHDAGDFDTYTVETLESYLDYESYGYDQDSNSDGTLTSFGWLECCE